MSDTGGGHRASAEAIRQEIALRAGLSVQVDVLDLLSDSLPAPVSLLPGTYPFLVKRTPYLWGALWHFFEREGPILWLERASVRAFVASIQAGIDRFAPDLIVSVHPLVQHLTVAALARSGRSIPFVTVLTDLVTPHRGWFHPAVTRCYVPTEAALARARAAGLREEQLRCIGLPVRPAFMRPMPPRADLRRGLALDPLLLTVLLLGGGDGVGRMEAITRKLAAALDKRGCAAQLVVVCGRNETLYRRLCARTWPQPVRVLGYVDNMEEWMHAADCVVTKAGPGTIAEALVCGLPLILIGAIPGQEEGNIDYVVQRGAGRYCPTPAAVSAQVLAWCGDGRADFEHAADCAESLATPVATATIVEDLLALLGQQTTPTR